MRVRTELIRAMGISPTRVRPIQIKATLIRAMRIRTPLTLKLTRKSSSRFKTKLMSYRTATHHLPMLAAPPPAAQETLRSEERRVGKEGKAQWWRSPERKE